LDVRLAGRFTAAASSITRIAEAKADSIGRRNDLNGDGDGADESKYQNI
jgi:hypothetical protein